MGKAIDRDSILGLPVICERTGKKIGLAEDVQCDPVDRKIEGIIVVSTGYRTKTFLVDFKDIVSIGEVIVVAGYDCAKEINKKDLDGIVGRTVIGDDGQELGMVSNIIFNTDGGHIEGYELSKGVLDDLVVGRNILTGNFKPYLYEDAIVIPGGYSYDLKSNNRGIINILSDSKESYQ